MKKALNSVINVDAAINLGLIFRQKATDYKNLLPPSPSLPSSAAQSPATRSRFLWRVAATSSVIESEEGILDKATHPSESGCELPRLTRKREQVRARLFAPQPRTAVTKD